MRIRSQHSRIVLGNRPFAGDLGASLYVGTSRTNIKFRRGKVSSITSPSPFWTLNRVTIDPGSETVPKSQRVAVVESPDESLEYQLPELLYGESLWYQIRTYQDDYENETIYRPQRMTTDEDGNDDTGVTGTARILLVERRDGGKMRLQWAWTRARDGVQPTSFRIVKVTGSGVIADVTVPLSGDRTYEGTVSGLSDAVAYTFRLEAIRGSVVTVLVTGIAFTADNAGPPAVSGLVAVEL